ncbi:hypothetical protein AMAG_18512 [Allomyces macrogynus ATCC 38327]|uniref:Uncharacterized protein n=1 Tax=Allomyces macrogynus (strain ATCC 38327) TaxID=578462 RepID=A0A0L0SCP0_ALLM3|nr:hypothetical protein AMAG_18512 [Allomyces macrogynus ATCC 38327]|eukprot:KNE60313.1 hypothetical protein AMAG_18512 [Allomyces macrogynus ATCC 38327]
MLPVLSRLRSLSLYLDGCNEAIAYPHFMKLVPHTLLSLTLHPAKTQGLNLAAELVQQQPLLSTLIFNFIDNLRGNRGLARILAALPRTGFGCHDVTIAGRQEDGELPFVGALDDDGDEDDGDEEMTEEVALALLANFHTSVKKFVLNSMMVLPRLPRPRRNSRLTMRRLLC